MSRKVLGASFAGVLIAIASGAASAGSTASQTAPGQQPPVNQSVPTIDGSPQVGSRLTAAAGSWAGNGLSFSYEWLRCDGGGGACSSVASDSSITLDASFVGSTVRVMVTASNHNGSAAATSDPTSQVVGTSPATTSTTTLVSTTVPPSTTAPTTSTTTTTTTPTSTSTTTTQLPAPQPGYTFCAWENATCSFSGSLQVIYGANGTFTPPRVFSNGVQCDNNTFGDPLVGTVKHCETALVTTPTNTTLTTSTTTTTNAAPSYSAGRFVYCIGDPGWSYNQSFLGGAPTPGWAWTANGYTAISSADWTRSSENGSSITPNRVYFANSVPVMQSVTGSYGQPGTSGPCPTVAVEIDASDTADPTISDGAQDSLLRIDPGNPTNPLFGPMADPRPQQGQTWWYGFGARTNSGYVPQSDPNYFDWNSFGLEWHSTIGSYGPIMSTITTGFPNTGVQSGPNGSIWYPCGQTTGWQSFTVPRLEIELTAGLDNGIADGDGVHTCRRIAGPAFHAGQLYKEIFKVTWDAYNNGSFSWWVDSGDGRGYVQYAAWNGISTLWRDGSSVDAYTYPELVNYRKTNNSVPASIMYYGGYIRGTSMADVSIP